MRTIVFTKNIFLFLFLLWAGGAFATPTCPIITQSFQNTANGTTVDNSSTGWYIDASKLTSPTYFAVMSNRFKAENIGAEGIWYSRVFSVAGYSSFQVAVKITAEGNQTSSEYVKVYYKIDGGAETLLDQRTGNFGTIDFTSGVLTGSNVQLVVKIYNYNNGSSQTSKYYIEQYRVFKETGPCAAGAIGVTASAGNGGVLTCTNPSLTLSAGTTATGTTTYSWTGPNSFTSTSQNPVISTAGTYTVVGTNAAGSGSASVTVTANKTAPDLTATGAALACASSVTINAASSVSGATYSWTGPNSFTSTSKTPSVSTAGTYTVTVTNPANGCTASQSVTVTAGTVTATTLWLEDFTLANGTVSDAGTTAWSISNTGTGAFSVQNNEFKASFSGANEGVWSSAVINIAGNNNVVISADLRSETAGSSDFFESDDYIRVYYKLNGGAETLIYDDAAGIGSSTTGTASISIASTSLNGSTLQVIIRARNSDPTERYFFDNVKLVGTNQSAVVTPSVTGSVTCTSSAQLNATVTGGTVTAWSWTGPNSFTASVQNPTITAGGQYIVTATISGGCTISSPITVAENKTAPDIQASGGALTCLPTVTLNVSSSVANAAYSWTGPNGFTSSAKNPVVSTAGTYTAKVTNPANGCTATQAVQVSAAGTDTINVTAAAAGIITCANTSVTLSGVSNKPNASYSWTGPNGFTSTVQNPLVSAGGIYTLTVTNPSTGCSAADTASVAENKILPVVTASAVGQFACNNTLISLSGSATPSAGVSYGWTGPNGFTSAVQNPSITVPGIYTLTVTNTATGCMGTDTANAILNNTAPVASAIPSGVLNCKDTIVTLSGSSTTAGVSYSWTGPNGFTSTLQTPTVKAGGNYTLTVTNPVNGCSGNTGVAVTQDTAHPANVTAVISSANTKLTCVNNNVTLQGNTPGTGFTYLWTSPGVVDMPYTSITVYNPGVYTYTVTKTANFCTTSVPVTVERDNAPPLLSVSPVGAYLSCTNPTATMTASSTTPGVTFAWSGPNGISSSTASVTATAGGNYTVMLTNPANGCTNNTTLTVIQNTTPPAAVTATTLSGSSQITCASSSQTLSASSSTSGVSFAWTGPNGFSANTATASTSVPGSYTLVATNPVNGCTATASIALQQNTAAPIGVTSTPVPASAMLTCANTSIALNGSAATPNVSYQWSGPNGNFSNSASASIVTPGTYVLTVTDPANGCTATATTSVTQNNTAPAGVTAFSADQITCYNPRIDLIGSSTTGGVTYGWTGPNGFTATGATTSTTVAGIYTLKVTDPSNGCFKTAQANVQANNAAPAGITATNSGPLTCTITEVTLTGSSASPNVEYLWNGPDGYQSFSAEDIAFEPGDYVLTVTNTENGCSADVTTTVIRNCSGERRAVSPNGAAAADSSSTNGSNTFEYKAYPNPFSDKAFIEFKSPANAFVSVQVYNSNGIAEKLLFNDKAAAGRLYKLTLAGRLPAGMHYVVIRVNNHVYTRQLISVQ